METNTLLFFTKINLTHLLQYILLVQIALILNNIFNHWLDRIL